MTKTIFLPITFLISILCLTRHGEAQNVINFQDTISFRTFAFSDTLDINYNVNTPYPDTMSLDLDCDGIYDVKINCYKVPVQNFPPEHHIEFQNLVGNDFQMLTESNLLQAFRADDSFNGSSATGWASKTTYQLLHFFVLSGASWAGINGFDSTNVTHMYVVFRKKIQGQFHYGWIRYSGFSWPAHLYLEETAFDRPLCTALGPSDPPAIFDINIYPNPFSASFTITTPDFLRPGMKWRLYSVTGQEVGQGTIANYDTAIDASIHNAGLYMLQVLKDNIMLYSKMVVHL